LKARSVRPAKRASTLLLQCATRVAATIGGHRLFVLPELELVVVKTAGRYNSDTIGATEVRRFRKMLAQLAGAALHIDAKPASSCTKFSGTAN